MVPTATVSETGLKKLLSTSTVFGGGGEGGGGFPPGPEGADSPLQASRIAKPATRQLVANWNIVGLAGGSYQDSIIAKHLPAKR